MSIRCKNPNIGDISPWAFGTGRSLGQMVREARDMGVMPDMDTVQGAFDDDGETTVDKFANPRTDPMDLMNEGLLKERSAMLDSIAAAPAEPAAPAAPAAPAEPAAPAAPAAPAEPAAPAAETN